MLVTLAGRRIDAIDAKEIRFPLKNVELVTEIAREPMPGPDEVFLDAEEHARLENMLASLDERSADVVRRRYGLIDGRQAKLADIGAIWGITAERVRQIERHAIAKLRGKSVLAA